MSVSVMSWAMKLPVDDNLTWDAKSVLMLLSECYGPYSGEYRPEWLSEITGKSYSEISSVMASLTDSGHIKSVHWDELSSKTTFTLNMGDES